MPDEWYLGKKPDIERFLATFSYEQKEKRYPYIGIRTRNGTEYFRTEVRDRQTRGFGIYVSEDALKPLQDNDPVTFFAASEAQYRFYRLLHDVGQRLALAGLIIAIIGAVIDVSLAIGEVKPLIIISPSGKVLWMLISSILSITGLVLVFWKGLLKGD